MSLRVGHGMDAHRLVAGRPLMLGGMAVPHDQGLDGHSDGDCLLHAICDALLGAAAAGDMGVHFPSRDARWKDAPSVVFLRDVRRIIDDAGYAIENVDATVVAERPALSAHLPLMRTEISRALGLPESAVSLKAKSTDGLGTIGRGEGIAAFAVACIRTK